MTTIAPLAPAAPDRPPKLPEAAARTMTAKVILASRFDEISRLIEWFTALAGRFDIDDEVCHAVQLCLDEAVTNVITHGFEGDETQDIEIWCERDPRALRVTVSDQAAPFDPTKAPAVRKAETIDDATVGGWGIELIRSFTEAVTYQRRGTYNLLTMSFPATPHN